MTAAWEWDGTFANGADGTCQNCGADTDEPHHLYCGPCYRIEQGWDEPPDEKLEEDLDRIDGVLPLAEECPRCGDTRVLFPSPDGRRCIECRWPR